VSWARVKGHEPLIRAFERAVARGRLGHAYLFAGPEGVGKKLFAIELAKTLLCEDPPAGQFDACDQCRPCVQVDARTHPDFRLVGLPEDKHEFPIELMQKLIENLAMKPARQRKRVAIIDDADAFNDESANCFLKTLEEPPPASLLILISTSPDRQLPTIVSRCQLVRFAPLPEDVVAEQLLREDLVEKKEEALRLAKLSGGSLGDARALSEPDLWRFRRHLLDGLAQPRPDSVGLAQALVKFVEEAGKESAAKRQRARQVLGFLIDFLRAVILLQQGHRPQLADPPDAQAAGRLAERLSENQLLQIIDRCLEADYQVDRFLQLSLVLEALLDALGERLQR
jgi:DNA polymerase III subunit delta'